MTQEPILSFFSSLDQLSLPASPQATMADTDQAEDLEVYLKIFRS